MPFTSGESRYAHIYSHITQFSDTLSWTKGMHYLRLGGSIAQNTSGGDGTEFGSAFVLGQYTVNAATTKPPDQLALADMQRYQQSFNLGDGTYELSQQIYDLFVQDNYRVRPDLTLDLGLRYDRQTFSDGKKNFAPRLGFGWNPGGDPKTVGPRRLRHLLHDAAREHRREFRARRTARHLHLRSDARTDRLPDMPDVHARAVRPERRDLDAAGAEHHHPSRRGGVLLAVPRHHEAAQLRQHDLREPEEPGRVDRRRARTQPPRLRLGRLRQAALDRSGSHGRPERAVAVHAHRARTGAQRRRRRSRPGRSRRSTAAIRQINVVENLGVADYDGLQTMVRWQTTKAFVSVSYTLSKATNTTEPDGNGAGQKDFNQLGEQERGPSLLDQRHRAVIAFSYQLPYNHHRRDRLALASAKPFNATTGVDNNGDGNNNDRPVINGVNATRYSFRGTAVSDTAVYGEIKVLPMGSRSVTLRLEAFNIFNHANVLGRNGTYGDTTTPLATFGQASPGLANIDPGRMFQFTARFNF